MKKIALASASLFVLPFVAFAQGGTLAPLQQLIVSVGNIVALLIPICIGVAMLAFFWGLVQYIRNPAKETGKAMMINGILALFIMVSIWGIIQVVQVALLGGSNPTNSVNAPHFPTN